MTRRNILSLAASAGVALSIGLATTTAAFAADKVKVGVFMTSSSLPYFIALNRGYFKEVDIEVETVPLASHPLVVQAIVAGSIDAASNLVTLEGANINVRRPGTLSYISLGGQNAQYITEQFVVKADNPAKSLKDLKGTKLFAAPGPANLGAAKAILKVVGLEEGKDYTIQEQQMGVHLGALQAGTFDGGYTLEPIATSIIAQGVGRRLEAGVIATYLLGDSKAEAYAAGGVLSGALLKDRPDVAARYAKAWAKGVAAANTDPTAREYLSKDMNVAPALASIIPIANLTLVKDLTEHKIADLQKFVDIGVQLGVVNGKIDVKTMLKSM